MVVMESHWAPLPGAEAHLVEGLDFSPCFGILVWMEATWGLMGTDGPRRATGGSPGASRVVTGLYLVAPVQEHPRRGRDVHRVQVEGAGRRVVGSLGDLLPVGERRRRTSPSSTAPCGLHGVGD